MNALFFFAQIMPQIQPDIGKLSSSNAFFSAENEGAPNHQFAQLVDQYSLAPEDGDFSQQPMSVAVEKLKLHHPFFSDTKDDGMPDIKHDEMPGQGPFHSPLLAQVMQAFAAENEETPATVDAPLIEETALSSEINIEYAEEAPAPDLPPVEETIISAGVEELVEEQAEAPVQSGSVLASTPVAPALQPAPTANKTVTQDAVAPVESEEAPATPTQNPSNPVVDQKPQNAFGQVVSELAQNKEDGSIDPKALPQHPGQNQVQPSTTPTSSVVQIVQQMDAQAHQSETQITKQASNPELAKEVGVEIAHMAKAGKRNFSIRLDPPEMGRIDIRMTLGQDAQVKAVMTVEHERTLDVLQRDMRSLERALENAGFKPDNMTLNLSLKQQGQGQTAEDQRHTTPSHSTDGGDEEAFEDLSSETIAQLTGESRPLDLRV